MQPSIYNAIQGKSWVLNLHCELVQQSKDVLALVKKDKNYIEYLLWYKGSHFEFLNRTLRAQRKLEGDFKQLDDALTEMMACKWNLSRIKLYRSLDGKYAKEISKMKVGDVFANKAYSSTAFDLDNALSFDSSGETVLLVIKLMKHMPFIYIDAFRDMFCKQRNNARWVFQSEVLLPKNVHFEITKKESVPMNHVHIIDTVECSSNWFRQQHVNVIYVNAHIPR